MSNKNETNYLKALLKLDPKDKQSEDIEFRIYATAIKQIEDIMKKMEWNLSVTVNSCLTYTLSVKENINLSKYKQYEDKEGCELITPGLTIKNERRIIDLAEKCKFDLDANFLTFVLTESVFEFYDVFLTNVSGDENE